MLTDRHDNPLSTQSPVVRDAYVAGVDHILAATHGAVAAFERAVAADPTFALGHVGLARARMYQGDMAGARAAIADARALTDDVTPREAAHVAVFDVLLQGRVAEARRAVFAHVAEHPRDVLVAQICGLLYLTHQLGRHLFFTFGESVGAG